MNWIKLFLKIHTLIGLFSIILIIIGIYYPIPREYSNQLNYQILLILTIPAIIIFSGLGFLLGHYDNKKIDLKYRLTVFIITGLNFILSLLYLALITVIA